MKKNFFYLLLFVTLCAVAFFFGIKNNKQETDDDQTQSVSSITNKNQVDSKKKQIAQTVKTDNKDASLLPTPERKNPTIKKERFIGRTTSIKSIFSTNAMTDSEYKAFDKRENKLNAIFLDKAFITVLDLNGDGTVSPDEKAEFEKEIKISAEHLEKTLNEAQKITQNQEEKNGNKLFENACRTVHDEFYRQHGYDAEKGFPPGAREKMNEDLVRRLPGLLNLVSEEVRKQSTKSLAL